MGFQVSPVLKNPPASAGDTRSIPGSGRDPGGGHGSPLQNSCLGIPWTEEPGGVHTVHGVRRSPQDWSDLARTHAGMKIGPWI